MKNDENIDSSIGYRLSLFLDEENIKSNELARLLNVSESFMSQVLNNKKKLSDVHIKLIYNIYGLNVEWLLYGIGNMYLNKTDYDKQVKTILTIFQTLNPRLQQLALQYFKFLSKLQSDINTIFEESHKNKTN